LSAVSHDLKTPLAAIFGAGTELIDDDDTLEREERLELARAIVEEAERLNQLVTNLLDVARLEGAPSSFENAPSHRGGRRGRPGEDGGRLREHKVKTSIPEDVPMVPMDPTLIRQVFVNLFENVLRYTPQDSPIEIHARPRGATRRSRSPTGVLAFLKRNQRGSSNASTAGVPAKREMAAWVSV